MPTHLMRKPKLLPTPQQRCHHRMLAMCMYTAPRVPQFKRVPKQRRASRFLQIEFRATVENAIVVRRRLWVWEYEDVCRLDAFFLHA